MNPNPSPRVDVVREFLVLPMSLIRNLNEDFDADDEEDDEAEEEDFFEVADGPIIRK